MNVIKHYNLIQTFIAKLDLWHSRIQEENSASFSHVDSAFTDGNLESEMKKEMIT